MNTRRRQLRQSLLGAASLFVTPTLLFISPTIPIYIRNQDDLNNQIDVLLPFVFLFFATWLVGLILWWASGTWLGRVLLWSYYLGGSIFLFFNVIGSNALEPTTQLLALGAFVVGAALLSVVAARYVELGRVTPLIATIGCLLLLYEAFQFIGGVNWARGEPAFAVNDVIEAEVGAASGAVDKGATLPGTSGQHISNGLVSYRFTVPEAGRYRLRARLITPSGGNNSAFVRLDSEERRVWAMTKSSTWHWQDAPFEWTLDKGTHMLTLENREQIWIDQIELSEVKK